jgi:hypothetical protein
MTARVPAEQEQAIIEAYLAGGTTTEVGSRFGYSGPTVSAILKRYGIKARTNSETHRRFAINDAFFDIVDTEEKAYWLGFISADGTIIRNRIVLSLQLRDKEHLHKFTKSLASEHPIRVKYIRGNGKVYSAARVGVESRYMVETLRTLGIGERKSLVIKPCAHIPEQLMRHYWRGVVDGDGSIYFSKRNKIWVVGVAGSFPMISGFVEFINPYIVSKAKINSVGKIFTVVYGGNELPKTILSVLYNECTIYLDRKKALADHILGHRQLSLATVDGSQEAS